MGATACSRFASLFLSPVFFFVFELEADFVFLSFSFSFFCFFCLELLRLSLLRFDSHLSQSERIKRARKVLSFCPAAYALVLQPPKRERCSQNGVWPVKSVAGVVLVTSIGRELTSIVLCSSVRLLLSWAV